MPFSTDVVFDPAAAVVDFAAVRAALAGRDWTAVRSILDLAEPVHRSTLIGLAADEQDIEGFLEQVLADARNDTAAAALLGARMIRIGWAIRTSARAEFVSRKQFAALHDWLRRAELVLIEAAARNPADCAVWVQRLVTARGLELGLSESRRRYDRLAAVDPHHLPGQETMLQALCPKWSGSWPQAHAFARECMLAAPPGAHQGVLVAQAHLEQWLELSDAGDGAGRAYLANEPVRTQIHEAAHRSVWHTDFRRTTGWVATMSTFAMTFSVMGDQPAAASLFTALGNLAHERSWSYFPSPVHEVRTRRARALRAKGHQ